MTLSSKARKAKLARKPKSKGFRIFFLVMSGILLLIAYTLSRPPSAREIRQQELVQENYLLVKPLIEQSGASTRLVNGRVEIMLPTHVALEVSDRAAKELALMGKSRVGVKTVVVSPAGQVLAESD